MPCNNFRTASSHLCILCPIFSVDAGMYISWQNVPLVEWILFHSRHDLQIARHVSSHAALPCTVHISGPNTLFIHVSLINLERRFSKADLHTVFNMMNQNWCYFSLTDENICCSSMQHWCFQTDENMGRSSMQRCYFQTDDNICLCRGGCFLLHSRE